MKSPLSKLAGALVALSIAVYAFFTLQGPQGIPALKEKRRQIQEYERQNAALARQIEEERARINRFDKSQPEQEQLIRQRLKLVKPGEKVFMLQDAPAGQSQPATHQ